MRKIILLSTLVFLVSHKSFSQEIIYDTQPIPEYLKVSLRGVKYGHWNLTQDQVNYLVNNQNDIQVQMVFSIVEYLKKDINLENVAITPEQTKQLSQQIKSYCEVVAIEFTNEGFKSDFLAVGKIQDMQWKFTFCDGAAYIIHTNMNVSGNTNYSKKPRKHFARRLKIMEGYNRSFQRELPKKNIIANTSEIKVQLNQKSERHPIEGIYDFFSEEGEAGWSTTKIAIIKSNESNGPDYHLIYLEGHTLDWIEGEPKASITKTLSPKDFKMTYHMVDKSIVDGSISLLENAIQIYINGSSAKFIKVY